MVDVRLVEQYEPHTFRQLVHRNLEQAGGYIDCSQFGEGVPFRQDGKQVRIGAFDGEDLIGLSWGEQLHKRRFMMFMSLVEKPYRRQGVYSRMLDLMLGETKEFAEIESTHHILNNAIIALKLRKGFYICGFDQSLEIGPRVKLKYFHNPKHLQVMRYRTGLVKNLPDLGVDQ